MQSVSTRPDRQNHLLTYRGARTMDSDMEAQMYSLRWKNYQAGWKSLYSEECFFIYTTAETVSVSLLKLFTLQRRLFLYLHYSRDCFFLYTTAKTVSLISNYTILSYFLVPIFLNTKSYTKYGTYMWRTFIINILYLYFVYSVLRTSVCLPELLEQCCRLESY